MLVVFISYLAVVMGIAVWSSFRARSSSEYILGGKKLSGFSLALSERAAGESAWLLLGLTGLAFTEGYSAVWVALGCVIGILFIWLVMADRLREMTQQTGALTIPSLISGKFPGTEKTVGFFSALIIFFFFLFYIAAQFSGAGEIVNLTFGYDPLAGKIIGSVIVIAYTMLGGFLTVVYVDIFQAFLMIFTLVVLPVIALIFAMGNDVHLAQTIAEAGVNMSSLTMGQTGGTAVLFIMSGMSWALGYTGQPHLLARMMALRNKADVRTAIKVASVWTIFAYIGAILIGLTAFAFYQYRVFNPDQIAALSGNVEKALPVLVVFLVNPVLAGILLSGAISAMISTASSQVMVASSALSQDVIKKSRLSGYFTADSLVFNKVLTLVIGLTGFLLAITSKDTVYGFVSYAWSGIGSSFGPALVLLLFWKRFSRAGVYASLFFGTAGSVIWKNYLADATGISERLGSYVIAFIMAVLFSVIFPEKKISIN